MGEITGISWCDRTYNAWIGCTKVSEGCKLCYAERDNERYHWTDKWGPDGIRHQTKTAPNLLRWNQEQWYECGACGHRCSCPPLLDCPQCHKTALQPTRQRVFVNSLSDLFEDRPELVPWRNDFWDLTQTCSQLDFLLLTKRPEDIAHMAPDIWLDPIDDGRPGGWPANIWLGVSIENQVRADERLPELAKHEALRWVSVEPMLGPVDLRRWLPPGITGLRPSLDWVVIGGESGPGSRPMEMEWARELQRQCQAAGVPTFMKQVGGWPDRRERLDDWPPDLRIREWPLPAGGNQDAQIIG